MTINNLDVINFIENLETTSDDDFINLFEDNFLEANLKKKENIIFNKCVNDITPIECKIMEHFNGDYFNSSIVYDDLYNFIILYKQQILRNIKTKMVKSLQQQYNIYILSYTNHAYYKAKSIIYVAFLEYGEHESQNNNIKIFKKYKYIKSIQKNDNIVMNYDDILCFDIYENEHIGFTINNTNYRFLIINSIKKLTY